MKTNDEILRRRDMRDVLTFTIDPASAKDYDDALSFAVLDDDTYQVGVHIADVTYYVKPGSKEDNDAYDRGTSVYLVDRVLPMLPERLCNDLCSLRENEDKLCLSVVFNLTHDARVVKYKVCRTVIRSDYRLTYEQAQNMIEECKMQDAKCKMQNAKCKMQNAEYKMQNAECKMQNAEEELWTAIRELNFLALVFRRQRMANGALEIEQDEPHFVLDENGHPVDIYYEKSTESHHLIEEFMLLTNRTIATAMAKHVMVYRVHDKPDPYKIAALERFKKKMGERVLPQTLDLLLVRAMAKAVYSTCNIGHYGLAFDYYTHFTSPIRRYPDMMVHRLVSKYLLGERGYEQIAPGVSVDNLEDLEQACGHCSDMEQYATQAERDSVKLYHTLWMADHVGEEHEGVIVSVTEYGLFVQLPDTHSEGLVPIRTICPGHYLELDEKNFCLRTKSKPKVRRGWTAETEFPIEDRCYMLGDKVRVKIVRVDLEKAQVEFELVNDN